MVAAWWAAVLISAMLPGAVAADQPVVVSVRVVAPGFDEIAQVADTLGLEQGLPIDRSRLREGVHALYAGGDIEYLQVEAERVAMGLEVTVRIRSRPRISRLEVQVPGQRWRRKVRVWLELEPASPVSAAQLDVAARRVVREFAQRGWTGAVVEPYMDYDRASNMVAVTVVVRLGEAERLHSVELVGIERELVGEVMDAVAADQGARLTERLVERTRSRVENELRRRGYWEARVVASERRAGEDGVRLVVRVEPGARYELVVVTSEGSEELVRSALPDPVKEDLNPAQTQALAERLRETLQEKGYLLADVRVELASNEVERVLTVAVLPDRQRRVGAVEFDGAEGVPRKVLEKAVRVRRGRAGGWRGQTVSDATLERDRLAVEDVYRRRGYAEVGVAGPTVEAVGDEEVTITFAIDEGRRWVLTDLGLEGFPADALAAAEGTATRLVEAGAWDERQVDAERLRLEMMLADVGYPDGRVTAHVDTSEPGQARVVMVAEPGPFVRIGQVVVAGLGRTREGVVRRTVEKAGVRRGAPFSRSALLEAQQQLYRLGLFRRVELVPIPGQEHRRDRGLVVRCEEGSQRSYLLGLGWDNVFGTRLTVGWSHLNLFGGAHAVSAEARLSQPEVRYQASLREARVPYLGVPGVATVYRTAEEFATYSQLRRGLWFEVGDRLRRPLRPWFRYEYQIVRPDAPPEILSELERQEAEIALASVTPSVEWDTRDDLLNPTRGLRAQASLEYAFPAFQANTRFLKLQTQGTVYGHLRDGSFAAGVHLAAIHPLGATDDQPENLQVPLATRFFAGGATSHRAFRTDYLGIEGQTLVNGEPIGGNALVLANVEYHRPIRGALAGVVFLDVGNVWAEPSQVSFDDLRWGAGLGLRMNTPAGPLRLEYGYKLDRLEGESAGELYLAYGVAF